MRTTDFGGAGRRSPQGRCGHCAAVLVPARSTQGWVRGVVYAYCGEECLEAHAAGVETWSAVCVCGADVLGDATACAEHLDGGESDLLLRLAG